MASPNMLLNGLNQPTGLDTAFKGYQQGEHIANRAARNTLLDQQIAGNSQALETGAQNLLLGEQRQQMNDLALRTGEQALTKDQAEFMLKDAATDAVQVKELMKTDPVRAQVAMANRIKKIQQRGGDPSDSIAVLEAMRSGNMDLVNSELDSVINAGYQTGLIQPLLSDAPQEMKVGRFRELRLPDGSTATLDTATNAVTRVASAPKLDLSQVPEDMRAAVANQPRDVQQKIVESFSSPATRDKAAAKEEEAAKAQEVTDKTKSLVTELLNNISGVKSVTGAWDEMTPTLMASSRNAQAAMDDLKNLLTVENLKLMSGVLSESDIKILRSVGASGLSGSQDRVIRTLKKMGEALGVNAGGGTIEDLVNKYAN